MSYFQYKLFVPFQQEKIKDKEGLDGRRVKNFTSDWNDGIIISALVDAIAPGLCPEYEDMKPENGEENAARGMKLAEDWLDVPQVSMP